MRTTIFGIGAGILLLAPHAYGDWPTPRHDTRRTGVSNVGSDIQKPATYWRSRLGGALSPWQIYPGDMNHDGTPDVLFTVGGTLVLATTNGGVLWRSAAHDYTGLVNVVDMDLDGQLDIIAGSKSTISILNGTNGQVEWQNDLAELGSPGAFRIADIDGDGRLDLWMDTCGCCAIETGSPGILYSFASGFHAPVRLGPPPFRAHCSATSNTVGDFDGDGHLELISTSEDTATLFRADGTFLAVSGPIPPHAASAFCQAVNVDGKPGDELICLSNAVYNGAGERGAFALTYRSTPSPTLSLLWNVPVSAADGGDARAPTSLTADLDRDGQMEVIVSGLANGVYTTWVLDAATGIELATVSGLATGDIEATPYGPRWLLVSTNTALSAFTFVRNSLGLQQVWQIPGQEAVRQADWKGKMRSGFYESLLTTDITGDSLPDLLVVSPSEPTALTGYDLSSGVPTNAGTYVLDLGVNLTAASPLLGGVGDSNMVVARNDGFVSLLGKNLVPLNQVQQGLTKLPGMYLGGYYTGPGALDYGRTPLAAKLKVGDAADALLVVDSRGDLVRIDPTGATNLSPAKPMWRVPDTSRASIRPAGPGPAVIGAFRRRHPVATPAQYAMTTLDPDGHEIASLTLPHTPTWEMLPGDFVGDGSTAWVGVDIDSSLKTTLLAMSTAGKPLWSQQVAVAAPLAVADWDGDGAADIAFAFVHPHIHSGKTGLEIATSSAPMDYFMPILQSLGSGASLDMILQGGDFPARALGHDLNPFWVASEPTAPYPYGALVQCGAEWTLVEGTWAVPSQLTRTQASGPLAGSIATLVLASGAAYPDVASAMLAHATLGQLTDVAVSANLDGSGAGPTALVGSGDGYLYAVNACTGTLRWSMSFGAPVGSPVLADTDGDGKDEIFVSVADGYLYALKNEILPAPSFVWDTDPPHGVTDKDVQSIETVSTLHAAWAPVPGALSYEVGVAVDGGSYITQESWRNVGPVTSVSMADLDLVEGIRYFVGVRAVSAMGRSPDKVSDGVLVHAPTVSDGGPDGAGAGGADGGGSTSTGGVGSGGAPLDMPTVSGRACICGTPGAHDRRPKDLLGMLSTVLALGALRAVQRARRGDALERRVAHRTGTPPA